MMDDSAQAYIGITAFLLGFSLILYANSKQTRTFIGQLILFAGGVVLAAVGIVFAVSSAREIITILLYLLLGVAIGLGWALLFYRYALPSDPHNRWWPFDVAAFFLVIAGFIMLMSNGFRAWPAVFAAESVIILFGIHPQWPFMPGEKRKRHAPYGWPKKKKRGLPMDEGERAVETYRGTE